MISRIDAELQRLGVGAKMRMIIIAQSAHETGKWKSNIFKTKNNCFGMTVKGKPDQFQKYETIEASVQELIAWLNRKGISLNLTSIQLYIALIKANKYFTDTYNNYYRAVKKLYLQLFPHEPKDQVV